MTQGVENENKQGTYPHFFFGVIFGWIIFIFDSQILYVQILKITDLLKVCVR